MNPALRKSGADMLRTMLVMLVAVGFLVLLVPRPSSVPRAVVDLSSAADQAGDVLGFAPATPVPQGWTVTSARVRRDTGDLPSWTINYLTPEERSVGLVQAAGWNAEWQTSLTHGGAPEGDVEVNGATWEALYMPEREITSLVQRGDEETLLVLARGGGRDDALAIARLLPPAP